MGLISATLGVLPSGVATPRGMTSYSGRLLVAAVGGRDLWEITDPDTPSGATDLGQFPSGLSDPGAMTSHRDRLLVTDDSGDELWEISDPDIPSGADDLGNFPSGLDNPGAMTSHLNRLLVTEDTADELWEISDPDTPSGAVDLGDFPSGVSAPRGMTSHRGRLFVITLGRGDLWEISDPDTPSGAVNLGNFVGRFSNPRGMTSHSGRLLVIETQIFGFPQVITHSILEVEEVQSFTAVQGDRQARLSWDALSLTPSISRYDTRYRRVGGEWSSWSSNGASISRQISGLRNGTEYEYAVRAVDTANNETLDVRVKAISSIAARPTIVFDTPGVGTWTVPAGITSVVVELVGAGGGGSSWFRRGRDGRAGSRGGTTLFDTLRASAGEGGEGDADFLSSNNGRGGLAASNADEGIDGGGTGVDRRGSRSGSSMIDGLMTEGQGGLGGNNPPASGEPTLGYHGGVGGGGAYNRYDSHTVIPGEQISYTVGLGGSRSRGSYEGRPGGHGAIRLTWRDPNQSPSVMITTPSQVVFGRTVVQLGSTASDPDGTIESRLWTATDGIFSNSAIENPTWTAPAATVAEQQFTLRLTVTDDRGATAFHEITITVRTQILLIPGGLTVNLLPALSGSAVLGPIPPLVISGGLAANVSPALSGSAVLGLVPSSTPTLIAKKIGNFPTSLASPSGMAFIFGRLFVVNRTTQRLWIVNNLNSPSAATNQGDLPSGLQGPSGMAAHSNRLLVSDSTGAELWQVATLSLPSGVRNLGSFPSGLESPSGMASQSGRLFVVDQQGRELWEVPNPDSPSEAVNRGTLPAGLEDPSGMTSHFGRLFIADNTGDELWEVTNPNSPTGATKRGTFPSGLTGPQSMTSHSGRLFIADSAGGEFWELVQINRFRATAEGSQVVLAWNSLSSSPAIDHYDTRFRTAGGIWSAWSGNGTSISKTISGLMGDTDYEFGVRAIDTADEETLDVRATATTGSPSPVVPLEIRGSYIGPASTLSGRLALGTDTPLEILGSYIGPSAILNGRLVLGSDTVLGIRGSFAGPSESLSGRLVLGSDTALGIRGSFIGPSATLTGRLVIVEVLLLSDLAVPPGRLIVGEGSLIRVGTDDDPYDSGLFYGGRRR